MLDKTKNSQPSSDVQEWLAGEPARCLMLVPDEIRDPQGFLASVGLEDAAFLSLVAGQVRPGCEPHPDMVEHLESGQLTDIVLLTTTSLRRFGVRAKKRTAVAFLEQQLGRLESYEALPKLRCMAGIRCHGWLWDDDAGQLIPFNPNTGELIQDRAIEVAAGASLATAQQYEVAS